MLKQNFNLMLLENALKKMSDEEFANFAKLNITNEKLFNQKVTIKILEERDNFLNFLVKSYMQQDDPQK